MSYTKQRIEKIKEERKEQEKQHYIDTKEACSKYVTSLIDEKVSKIKEELNNISSYYIDEIDETLDKEKIDKEVKEYAKEYLKSAITKSIV